MRSKCHRVIVAFTELRSGHTDVTLETIFKINPVLEVEDFLLLVRGGQTNSAFCLHEYEVVEAGKRADNPMVISNKSIILKPVVVFYRTTIWLETRGLWCTGRTL